MAKQCKPIYMARVCKHQLVQLPAEFRFSGCDHLGCTTRLDDTLAVLVARTHEGSLLRRSSSQESSLLWHRLRFCPCLALDPANGFSTDAGRPTNVAHPTSLAPAPHAVFRHERALPSGGNGASGEELEDFKAQSELRERLLTPCKGAQIGDNVPELPSSGHDDGTSDKIEDPDANKHVCQTAEEGNECSVLKLPYRASDTAQTTKTMLRHTNRH